MSPETQSTTELFTFSVTDGIASIHIFPGAFILGTDLYEKKRFFDCLAHLEQSDDVKAVLIFNSKDTFGMAEHRKYLKLLSQVRKTYSLPSAVSLLEREDNAFKQYALIAARYDKPIVSCLLGEISTPFFGLSLTSDFRLAMLGMSYRLSHVELGVPPVGGLGFLLPKFVCHAHAVDWLLCGGTITAQKACEVGLINAVLPQETFEEKCVEWIQNKFKSGYTHIKGTHCLINHEHDAFEAYLLKESKIRIKALYSTSID
jgi:enoyl-CoA hydratase/carnithine racemase